MCLPFMALLWRSKQRFRRCNRQINMQVVVCNSLCICPSAMLAYVTRAGALLTPQDVYRHRIICPQRQGSCKVFSTQTRYLPSRGVWLDLTASELQIDTSPLLRIRLLWPSSRPLHISLEVAVPRLKPWLLKAEST